jgi:hypothetical protein
MAEFVDFGEHTVESDRARIGLQHRQKRSSILGGC